MEELSYCGVRFRQQSIENYTKYFRDIELEKQLFFPKHSDKYNFEEHNNEYLTICYYNLKEKYLRGQKDFTADVWGKLDEFYKKEMGNE